MFIPAIALVVTGLVVAVALIILLVVLRPKGTNLSSSSVPAGSFPVGADCVERLPVYAYRVDWGNFPVMSNSPTFTGAGAAEALNSGDPIFGICSSEGAARIPLYVYGYGNDPTVGMVQVYSTSPFGATFQGNILQKQNGGNPLGYVYLLQTSIPSTLLQPLYVVKHEFSPTRTVEFLSASSEVDIGGLLYTSSRIIGYLPPE